MGLNTSFGAWEGAYSAFDAWRKVIAKKIGLNLENMMGFGGTIPFNPEHNLTPLLNHSDCDGILTVDECKKIKAGLEEVLKSLPKIDMNNENDFENDDEWAAYKAQLFIDGCNEAIKNDEPIEFF